MSFSRAGASPTRTPLMHKSDFLTRRVEAQKQYDRNTSATSSRSSPTVSSNRGGGVTRPTVSSFHRDALTPPRNGNVSPIRPLPSTVSNAANSSMRVPPSPQRKPRDSPLTRDGSPQARGRAPAPMPRPTTPTRNFSPQTREGRLTSLVKNFQTMSLKPWKVKLTDIESRQTRLRLMCDEDVTFLESISVRNRNFMRTIEGVLREAVVEQTGVENNVVHHAYAAWRDSSELDSKITMLLDTMGPKNSGRLTSNLTNRRAELRSVSRAGSPSTQRGGSPSVRGGGSSIGGSSAFPLQPQQRGRTTAPASSYNSPSRVGSPGRLSSLGRDESVERMGPSGRMKKLFPGASPIALEDVQLSKRNGSATRSQVSSGGTNLPRDDRRTMLEGLQSLSKLGTLQRADVQWAQSVFERLYGKTDADTRFTSWLHEVKTENIKDEWRSLSPTGGHISSEQ